ncbi:MAG: hypothetical protein Q7U74_03240, partial [Saprospiraceae bacterium]|nr:hypothetical protein [Saprospiraceae bacterium]
IPATILSMMQTTYAPFEWSWNLWKKNAVVHAYKSKATDPLDFAYYTNENGLGWATSRGKGFYEFGSKTWRIFEGELDSLDRSNAQAYLQTLYNDFLGK